MSLLFSDWNSLCLNIGLNSILNQFKFIIMLKKIKHPFKFLSFLVFFSLYILNISSQITDEYISQLPPQDMLHYGIMQGNLKIVKEAIEKGTDKNKLPLRSAIQSANKYSKNGESDLSFGDKPATRNMYIDVIKFLLQKGTDLNVSLDLLSEEPPLIVAAQSRDIDAVKLLLSYKANPNVKDQGGNTVLHILAVPVAVPLPYDAGPEIAKLLISNGAKNLKNENGKTPLDLRKKTKNNPGNILLV